MSVFSDMMSDMSNQALMKPCSGLSLAEVSSIKDPENLGRIKCKHYTADEDFGETGWIYCITPFGGKEYGCFIHPRVGDIVALVYEDGNIDRPYAIGSLWVGEAKPPVEITDGSNEVYKFITPNKSFAEFSDTEQKERITLQTPKERKVVLDDENELISVSDGKNTLEINGKSGEMQITCEKKLTIKVGEGVTITCDGSSGEIQIKTNTGITLDSAKVQIKASGEAAVEGNGSVTVKSSGVATIKGSMTKIN